MFIESLVFGTFTVLCALSIWILFSRDRLPDRRRSRLNRMLIATSAVMWILSFAVRALSRCGSRGSF